MADHPEMALLPSRSHDLALKALVVKPIGL